MSDVNAHIIQPLKKFAKDSAHLVKKCTKPDRKGKSLIPEAHTHPPTQFTQPIHKLTHALHDHATPEFTRIAYATSVGFLIMGFIGFFVKLIHIPINNILLGGI